MADLKLLCVFLVAPPSGGSSSAVTAGDMLTPMMALDINDEPPAATKVIPSAAMVR